MASVFLEGLTKRYDEVPAVDAIDLVASDGALTVLVGPSGCGKSTVLKLIAGLEDPDAGEIRIAGNVVNRVAPQHRDVAMVFQSYALYPHMTVAENLAFPLRMAGRRRAEIAERVADVARTLRIDGLLDRRPRALSGGEQQRVAIGRALVREPAVTLLDEPLSNLDAELRLELRAELARIQRELSATMIHVTHDQTEAMALADRLVVMRAGTIAQTGTPHEVYARPADLFVAGFIGQPRMNLMQVTGPDGREQTIGIRPHDVILGGEAPDGAITFSGTVARSESLGAEAHVMIDTRAGHITAAVPPERAAGRGEAVKVILRPERCHLFDPDGQAVSHPRGS